MNPVLQQIFDQIRGAWRFRWPGAVIAVAGALIGWCIVFALPDRYEAQTEVLVDTRTALRPALKDLTVDQDVSVQLDYVRQSLLVDAQLCKVVKAVGMLTWCDASPEAQRAAQIPLAKIRNHIRLYVESSTPSQGSNGATGTTFGIYYQDENGNHALQVVTGLLNLLKEQTLGGKREGSEQAQQFLESQIKDYGQKLKAAEDKLAEFKAQHLGQLPHEDGGYFTQLQKENDTVDDLRTRLATAENRRATLQSQLHGNAAVLASTAGSTGNRQGAGAGDTLSMIAEAQARLDGLRLKYTDKHPDVIAAQAELAQLKQRRAAEIESLRNGDAAAAAATGAGTNPVFQSIQLALNQADVDIADLRSQLSQHESKVQDLRRLLNTAPQVEAQYAQLTRDYDINKAQYSALLANYDKSKLGQRADDAGSIRFLIVQPPMVSSVPVSPKRAQLLLVVFVLALAAGGGLAFGLDQLQPVVSSGDALTRLTNLPVLTQVGSAFPTLARQQSQREVRQVVLVVAGLAGLLVIGVLLSRMGVRLSISVLQNMVHEWV